MLAYKVKNMKESLYGWYPSKGRWKTHNQDVTSYGKECLYKFTQSKFADEDGIRTPTPHSVKIRFASRAEMIKTPVRNGRTPVTERPISQESVANINLPVTPPDTPTPRPGEPQDTSRSSLLDVAFPLSPPPELNGEGNHPHSTLSKADSQQSCHSSGAVTTGVNLQTRPPSCTSKSSRKTPPTPKQAWLRKTEATPVTTYDAYGNPTNLPWSPYSPVPQPNLESLRMFEPSTDADKMNQRKVYSPALSGTSRKRAQSATVRRETPATPPRPVQSARPSGYGGRQSQTSAPKPPSSLSVRATSSAPSVISNVSTHSTRSAPPTTRPTAGHRPNSQASHSSSRGESVAGGDFSRRPYAPHPPEKFGASPPNGTRQEKSPPVKAPLDYDSELKKHGWRMEVPGDPLNLKGPCLPPRQPYFVNVPLARMIPPKPPKAHMQNYDTFFSNTVPRKPLSFTIHPEMISEVLQAKRMQLQKREGMIYQTKNYAFLY